MVKIIVSKNGYFYKIVNDKKIRISKEEYLKKNKNMKGGSPKTKITVIFVGAAELKKTNGSRNNKSGQIPNLMEYIGINPDNTLIAVDPGHGNNEIPNLSKRSGIPVSIMTNPNDVKPGCLNISGMDSQTFFDRFTPDELTYYVIFAFYGGIGKEMPSFKVAESIGIQNPFFYNIRNALCLGMSCFNIPPDITKFLINYGFHLEKPVAIPEIDQSLENAFYAVRSGLRILYKVEKKINGITRTEEQIRDILELLKKININSVEEACRYYEDLKHKYGDGVKDVDEGMIKDSIEEKYRAMNLHQFFRTRSS
jgi:hypothetical protein